MDVISRWRDAVTDPPPDGWFGVAHDLKSGSVIYGCASTHLRRGYWWLDVTDVPAVPREAVQAEVDRLTKLAWLADCECPTCDAIRAMCDELGITPTEE